jgi:hypothetical protein
MMGEDISGQRKDSGQSIGAWIGMYFPYHDPQPTRRSGFENGVPRFGHSRVH